MSPESLLALAAGLALGAALAWLVLRGRIAAARAEGRLEGRAAEAALEARLAERDRQLGEERGDRARLSDAFRALSAETLQAQGRQFLELANASLEKFQQSAQGDLGQRQKAIGELLSPVRETVARLGERLGELERSRTGAYAELREQVRSLGEAQGLLRQEAQKLVQALRAPSVRGRWGELQLRRVVELAGMQAHCDFAEQVTVEGPSGRLRPDLVVQLSNDRVVAVDAKAPLAAYLEALEASSEPERQAKLADHARQIRDHVSKLAQKGYQEHVGRTPDLVVLFLPNEAFLGAALDLDPTLMERSAEMGVLIATPVMLIGLLKAVALGWREEALAENARKVCDSGRELHDRVATMGEHVERLGKSLGRSVDAFNDFVGSLESRVLPEARRLKELGAASASAEVPELGSVDERPRALRAPELAAGG